MREGGGRGDGAGEGGGGGGSSMLMKCRIDKDFETETDGSIHRGHSCILHTGKSKRVVSNLTDRQCRITQCNGQ